ncbi:hypothetical protein J6590_048061 [Homalodisca vitripennis]|nr:hypothetical protein J6590_048061 [Homalodisca vitripennis]
MLRGLSTLQFQGVFDFEMEIQNFNALIVRKGFKFRHIKQHDVVCDKSGSRYISYALRGYDLCVDIQVLIWDPLLGGIEHRENQSLMLALHRGAHKFLQTAAMSSSEDETESDEDNSDESEESEDEDSEVEDSVEEKPSVVNDLDNIIRIEEEPIVRKLTEELYSMPGDLKINEFSVHELLQQFEQMKQHLKIKESIQEINETKKTYTIVNDDIPNVVKSSSVTANENATTSTITANENATTSTITANENATTSTITANENASTSTITANKNATTSTITANENATTSTITANENAITSTSEDQAPSEAVEVELLEDKSQEEIGEEVLSVNEDNGSNKTETPSVNTVEDSKKNNTLGSGDANVAVESSEHVECSRASQSEMSTKERHMQTSPPETRDKFSQTKEPDLYKELNKKIQDLNNQLAALSKETSNLSKQLTSKEATIARMEKSHKTTISSRGSQTVVRVPLVVRKTLPGGT